ncbi:MAG: molybdopterin molybdotransferase MoeA [bacterium]
MTGPISVEDARTQIVSSVPRMLIERASLEAACDRRAAQMILSASDLPSQDISAMDGYAVKSSDPGQPRLIVGESAAGRPFSGTLQSGEAVRIFTGAHVPPGADAVVMQELTTREGDFVAIDGTVARGANIRSAGSYLKKDEIVLDAGDLIQPSDIGVLASMGRTHLDVFVRPRVAIISTGDELVDLGDSPASTQIINSNGAMLAALVRSLGGIPLLFPVVRDVFGETKRAFERAAQTTDLVVSIGGVSVGDHDLAGKAIRDLATDVGFWKVRMKPGKPLTFGVTQTGTPMVGLPGNPMSAFVCFHQFVRPALSVMMGGDDRLLTVDVATHTALHGASDRAVFVPGRLRVTAQGTVFDGPSRIDSGNIKQLVGVDSIAILPQGTGAVPPGSSVNVQVL